MTQFGQIVGYVYPRPWPGVIGFFGDSRATKARREAEAREMRGFNHGGAA